MVNIFLSKVTVLFDIEAKKHSLNVGFSEEVSVFLESISYYSGKNTLKKFGAVLGVSLPKKTIR